MKTVYVVTSGCYSDYRIEALFEKKEDAEALASVLSDSNGVDEWDVNKQKITPVWHITMKINGDMAEDYGEPTAGIEMEETIFWEPEVVSFHIKADTLERAVKVANERRAIILSHNLWGDDEAVRDLFLESSQEVSK